MNHSEISALDLGIIAVYLLVMISIGVYSIRRVKNSGDYYVAGRSFGPLVLMATVCATIIGGSGLMGRAGVAYSSGFKAILTAVPYLLGMLIFSGVSGRISDIGMKYGITSIPELFEMRFGKTAKILLSLMVAFTMMGTVASQVTATATIIRLVGGSVGITYEINRWAGGHDNALTRILTAPGMWMQNFTTNEPDDGMIEVGIAAVEAVLPEKEGADRW